MAFCPNCGTPNTDEAEKCVACGFELAVPKQKAKFKGTIMMTGVKAPIAPPAGAQLPPPPTPPEPVPEPPAPFQETPPDTGARRLGFEKTMLGRPADFGRGPQAATPGKSDAEIAAEARARESSTLSQAHTIQQQAPFAAPAGRTPDARPTSSSFDGPARGESATAAPNITTGSGTYGGTRDSGLSSGSGQVRGGSSSFPPAPASKPNPVKLLAIGCAALLVLSCVIAGLLYMAFGEKLKALFSGAPDASAEAAAWHASISQSLAQVSALCQIDCARAGVFFHPNVEASLRDETKVLTIERVQKLSDPVQATATMLDGTDDESIASKLGLDPQSCARVSIANAKVISCSVPDPSGQPGVLRIVHMSGIGSL